MKNIMLVSLVAITFHAILVAPLDAQPGAEVKSFLLKVGDTESVATMDGATLVVDDGATRHIYDRSTALDSVDSRYIGFQHRTLRQQVLFPRSGTGRLLLPGPFNSWKLSEMTITPIATTPASPADVHERIDNRAIEIQRQARELAEEADFHYRSTPEYPHLVQDTSDLVSRSTRLHDLAHVHAGLDQMAAEWRRVDESFHHLEETFERIESNALAGNGRVDGHTAHVKELLESMEANIHGIQKDVGLSSPQIVTRPAFGQFANIAGFAGKVESTSNELLLDMHYNYSHNPDFKTTYAEAYQIMTVAKSVAAARDATSIQRSLKGMDELIHHLDEDIRGWTRHAHRQIGTLSLDEKLHVVEKAMHDLMDDAGVTRISTEIAPPPAGGPEIAPPPGSFVP